MTEEIAERESQELEPAQIAELAQQALAGTDDKDVVLPVVKLTQGQSREVQNDKAEIGHYINTLTGEDYGGSVELVVVSAYKGRFLSDDNDDVYVASGEVAPKNWPEEYAGKHFADIPVAEEQWKLRSNANEIEWGKGPVIETTHNFIGFRPEEPALPLRISLKSTSAKAGKVLNTLLRVSGAPWDNTYVLSADRTQNAKEQIYHVAKVAQGRQTTAEERQNGIKLFTTIRDSQVVYEGDDSLASDGPAQAARKPAGQGEGLEV